jgi:hypothetical protein
MDGGLDFGCTKERAMTSSGRDEIHRETYKKHEILIRRDPRRTRLFIDGAPVGHGKAGDQYYLDVYAYDRADSLLEVVRRYIDYRARTQGHAKKEG